MSSHRPKKIPAALTIAGSDPSGGAGLQADLKTFHQFGVYGLAVPSLITVQNTLGVRRVEVLDAVLVREQLEVLLKDLHPQAVKTGALGNAAIIQVISKVLSRFRLPLVVDPVFQGTRGAALLERKAVRALLDDLIPKAFLVTPNLLEAEILTGIKVRGPDSMLTAARALTRLGARAVLIKGGHLKGPAIDLLFYRGRVEKFSAPRILGCPPHGTGCAFSAAITAALAGGRSLTDAVRLAKQFIVRAIREAQDLGRGARLLNYF